MLMTNVESDRPSLGPGHPVGDRPHLDRRQHRLAQHAVVEQRLQGPHRVVVPHVLVDLKHHAGLLARLDQARGLVVRHRQRLLRQDAAHPARMRRAPGRSSPAARSAARRRRRLRSRGRRASPRGCRRLWERPQCGRSRPCLLDRPRRDPDDAEPGVGVGHQVAVADDEARAHHADPEPASFARRRKMVQADGGVCRHRRLTHAAAWASCPLRAIDRGGRRSAKQRRRKR